MSISSLYLVDAGAIGNPIQTGSIDTPFQSISRAIAAGQAVGSKNIEIKVGAGLYPETIVIPIDMVVVVKGTISGICILGDVIFNAHGSFNPIMGLGTACSFNDVIIQDVKIVDGDPENPATNSVFITQNSTILGSITQSGNSFLSMFFAGIGTANAVLDGLVQSSQITGNILLPHCNISATNTSFNGNIIANQIYCSGCDLAELASAPSGIELHQCIVDGSLTSDHVYLDNASFHQVITNELSVSSTPILLGRSNLNKIRRINSGYQMTVGDHLLVVDSNTDPVIISLPKNPHVGLWFRIGTYNRRADVIIIDTTKKINGEDQFLLTKNYGEIIATYIGSDQWLIT